MKIVQLLLSGLVCAGTVGCASQYADVPAPTRFANEEQLKLQAARHWQLIAEHFAGQMAVSLEGKLNGRAVYIPQPGGEQEFVEGFRDLLITALVAKGVPVATSASGAMVADVRYNAYLFNPDRAASTYYYGEATMLAVGLWAVGSIVAADISPAAGVAAGVKALGAAATVEGFAWLKNEALRGSRYASGAVPRTEIMLTVSIADAGRIVSRQSNIYYTADEDSDLYWKRGRTERVISVVGDCGQGAAKCAR